MFALARLVTRHPWWVLLAWVLAALLSVPLAAKVPSVLSSGPGSLKNTESTRVADILRDHFGERDNNTVLLVSSSHPPLGTPQGQAAYQTFVDGLQDVPGVSRVVRSQATGMLKTQSEDGGLALTLAQIPAVDGAQETLGRIRTYAAQHESAGLKVQVTGGQAIADDFTTYAERDTKRSEMLALPLIALMLVVVFGALVATALPIVVGLLGITVAMAGLYGLAQLTEVSSFAQSVITMLGLGAGIDYALLMVNRFREELAREDGRTREHNAAAARRTILTAGRSITFSGLTVAIAMAGLIVPQVAVIRSMGIGGVLAVLLIILASLTVLPALLTLLGERINSPRLLKIGWAQSSGASVTWTAFARRVTARPWVGLLLGAAFLLMLSMPAWSMRTGYAGAWGLSPGIESRDALVKVRELGAGGLLSQFEIILDLQGKRYGPTDRQKFQAVVKELRDMDGVKGVLSPFITAQDLADSGNQGSTDAIAALSTLTQRSFSRDRTFLRVSVIPDDTLKAEQIPPFEEKLHAILDGSGYPYHVGGGPIGGQEWSRSITGTLPTVIISVFLGTFVLLMLAFRSLLIPLKSILMNALTVGAAIGMVTLIVQDGFLASLFGLPTDAGVLDSTLPVLLFAVTFGLSMDYEIFLLSRVHEEYLAGKSNDEAIVQAVGHTARIITSAAIIMFIVFTAFIFGRVIATSSIGLGLAMAVILDATLVRLILVPNFMKLAGKWNWWLPRWLDRILPELHLEH